MEPDNCFFSTCPHYLRISDALEKAKYENQIMYAALQEIIRNGVGVKDAQIAADALAIVREVRHE